MDPKGKAPEPIPPYRPDAQKGYLPSVPFPHAGPEPSGQTLQNIHKGNSLEAQNSSSSSSSSRSNQDSSNPKCKHSFSLPQPGHVRASPSVATSRTGSKVKTTAVKDEEQPQSQQVQQQQLQQQAAVQQATLQLL